MPLPVHGFIQPVLIGDSSGNPVDIITTAGIRRLAVNALIVAGGVAPLNTVTMDVPTFATVGVADAVALPANASRKYLALVNDSLNTIYLAFDGNTAVVGRGVRLNSGGGSVVFDAQAVTLGAVHAIATGAGSNMGIQEGS